MKKNENKGDLIPEKKHSLQPFSRNLGQGQIKSFKQNTEETLEVNPILAGEENIFVKPKQNEIFDLLTLNQ